MDFMKGFSYGLTQVRKSVVNITALLDCSPDDFSLASRIIFFVCFDLTSRHSNIERLSIVSALAISDKVACTCSMGIEEQIAKVTCTT